MTPRVLGVLLLLGSGAALAAQARQPTFTTSTHYVTLDVMVTDRDDRPAKGLTKDDFTIVERGRPQPIADFAHVEIPVGDRVVDPAIEPPPGSDIAVNSASLHESRAIAIVVDDTALGTDNIVWVKRVLGTMLGAFSPADQVAFTYVRRSDLSRDFTNDAAQHARSVQRLGDALGFDGLSGKWPVMDLLTTLENVVKTMSAARQSRRVIVLVGSRGCNPQGPEIIHVVCKGVVDRSRQAGVPIYAIDPTGDILNRMSDLATLAVATGGIRYLQAEPWLSPARLMTDNGSYYLLGYYPKPLPTDGKFQDVEVKVNRPGLVVRARRGYTAPWWRQVTLAPQQAMTAALGAGLPDPSLPIRVFVAPLAPGGRNTTRAVVTVEVAYPAPPGGFGGDFSDEWRVGILALDPDGRTKASFQRPVTFSGTWKPSAQGTFVINETIDVPSQLLTFRVGVTSKTLGRTGTAHITVDVPDFRDADLRLSHIVLGNSEQSLDVAIGLDRLKGLVPFQPSTQRAFKAGGSIRVFGRASWRGTDAPLQVTVEVLGTSTVEPVRFTATAEPDPRGQREVTMDRAVSLSGLAPGVYTLRLSAFVSDDKPVVRQIPFEIR